MTAAWRFRLVLFALVWFSCAWFGSWAMNPNTATRLFAAVSLVEDGDARIDEFAPLTIDKAEFDGHAYLDKAPGMTLMALPAVALAQAATSDRSTAVAKVMYDPALERFFKLRLRMAVATGPALLTALAAVLLFDLANGLTASRAGALFASLGYALGSPVWGWSTTALGHAPVAALYVIALWGVWRGGIWRMALAGAALGWAVVVEYQALIAGGALGVLALWRIWHLPRRWTLLAAFTAAGVAALLPLFAYNLLAFGTPFRIGYSGVVGWEGMHQGLFGLGVPDLGIVWEITFAVRRGLFWVAPVLALGPLGLALGIEERRSRAVAITAAAAVMLTLLVNAAYVYWDGGNATGPRLAVPMIGLLALGLAPFWQSLETRVGRIAAIGLLALSMALNLAIAAAEIFAPPNVRFPIWSAVLNGRFRAGDLQTVASDWWGWSTWAGFALWMVVALPMIGWLVREVRRDPA